MRAIALIGFAEALSAPEVTWSLADAGFEVIAFSRRGRKAPLRRSRYATVHEIPAPESNCAASLAALYELMVHLRSHSDVSGTLLALDDAAVWLCGRVDLPDGWSSAAPRGPLADFALDKERQIRAAAAAGFNVPASSVAHRATDVRQRRAELPLVLRPVVAARSTNGRLTKGHNWICGSESELRNAVEEWAESYPLLVQPYIPSTVGRGVFGLATDAGCRALTAHRRLRMMNPHGSGSSACVAEPVPEEIKVPVKTLVANAGWRGLFMVELLSDRSGTLWFVEFNGRPWGSMALSRRQRFEYPAWAVTGVIDEPPAATNERRSTPLECRNLGRELIHLVWVLRGSRSSAISDWPSFWPTLFNVVWRSRKSRFYNWRKDDLLVFLSDAVYTIRTNVFKFRERAR